MLVSSMNDVSDAVIKKEVNDIHKAVNKINETLARGANSNNKTLNQINTRVNKMNKDYNANLPDIRNTHVNKKDLFRPIGILDPDGKEDNPFTGRPYENIYYNSNDETSRDNNTYAGYAKFWSSLPMYAKSKEALELIYDNQVLLIVSGTGSGKTVLTPKLALHALNYQGRIAITNPKRLTTDLNARYAAKLADVRVGEEVGVWYRGRKDYDKRLTRLVYCTDGIVLQSLENDPTLSDFDMVIIDEAHERNVNIDLLLLKLKELVLRRPNFKLIIMSATINKELFINYFPKKEFKFGFLDAGEKPNFPVKQHYLDKPINEFRNKILSSRPDVYIEAAVDRVVNILTTTDDGDILVFLTGSGDELKGCSLLDQKLNKINKNRSRKIFCTILHAGTSGDAKNLATNVELYKRIQGKSYTRKVVMANEVAESSVTIDGVNFVVDSGFSKQSIFYPEKDIDALELRYISKAAHDQRKGRTGRTGPGECYNLFTKDEYEKLFPEFSTAPILIQNISANILGFFANSSYVTHVDLPFSYKVKKGGKASNKNWVAKPLPLAQFLGKFLEPPTEIQIKSILKRLFALGAWEYDTKKSKGTINKMGRAMSTFRINPQLARMLIAGYNYKCRDEICNLAAILEASEFRIEKVFKRFKARSKQKDEQKREEKQYNKVKHSWYNRLGDHFSLLDIYSEFSDRKYGIKDRRTGRIIKNSEDPEEFGKWCTKNYLDKRVLSNVKRTSSQYHRNFGNIIRNIRNDKPNAKLDYLFIEKQPVIADKLEDRVLQALARGFYINIVKHSGGSSFVSCFPEDKVAGRLDRLSFFVLSKQLPAYAFYTELKSILNIGTMCGIVSRVTPALLKEIKENKVSGICIDFDDCKVTHKNTENRGRSGKGQKWKKDKKSKGKKSKGKKSKSKSKSRGKKRKKKSKT